MHIIINIFALIGAVTVVRSVVKLARMDWRGTSPWLGMKWGL